jgi:4-alpha-glucanotransferase
LAASAPPPSTPEDRIDRDAAWTAKREALAILYDVPRSAARQAAYDAFLSRQGRALVDVARWSVLAEDHGNDHRTWPPGLADAASDAVDAFAAAHPGRIDFAMWQQWLVEEQMAAAQEVALGAGMRLGVMHDLAVGVSQGGADAWRLADTYAAGVTVGAPPDPYNQLGQNWGQPPWRPDRLAEQAYAPFRDMIAAVLRHAGGVRVDHIIGLFRLWLVPEGMSAHRGTYLHYDHEALIGVLALEAHRAGAVVVGEDLGVVPPEARGYLASRGILGTSILWFERDHDGPIPAPRWREWCLASVTTHDLPPTAGYLAGDDIRLQHRLGLLPGDLDDELEDALAARREWLEVVAPGRAEVGGADPGPAVLALHDHLAESPSRLVCVALVDAVGDRRTQNQPGTVDEYPNWRLPLAGPDGTPVRLEDLPALALPLTRQLARQLTRGESA